MAVEQFTLHIFPQLTVEFYYHVTVAERQKGLSLIEEWSAQRSGICYD